MDKARLQQARVTKDLRVQARQAVERFVQEVLDRADNRDLLEQYGDRQQLAKALWREGLIVIYRLLFILKLEASDDTAQSFSFASTSLWRNTFSPSGALTRYARAVLDRGVETGNLLESGLRNLFRMFTEGVECTELNVKPMGGALFGANATPILSELQWGERAVAHLLDRLLWTTKQRGSVARQRVYYGPLNVEDLGRVYEALLELESGITTEPMCRLRRQKLEVVVPVAQGLKYRPATLTPQPPLPEGEGEQDSFSPRPLGEGLGVRAEEPEEEEEPDEEIAAKASGKKTMVEWIEEIPPNRFYLRVGLGRKASGSYYTPHSFVRFLVQETLGALVAERSPQDNPNPNAILKLKVLDPAMGSGHFLVEACRFLGEKLYEACRLCDDRAIAAEQRAESKPDERDAALAEARLYRQRVIDLPDPDDKLVKYLETVRK
ncbi:MAG: BREX-1 system adenine-specific DNA-methyltransferase PglX [Leptolyngbyaceae cyanobacterium CAN_BIN12]|nr:BREX-1 system adenine-specific DNA-methyltransferase PglX [Leptolyngbyaceae cyanobacterium CAN_BIN12]